MESILDKIDKIPERWERPIQATIWTVLLMFTVAVFSFAPEKAFVSILSSSWSNRCGGRGGGDGFVKIPMGFPGDMVCLPSEMVKKNYSPFDVFLPTLYAGVMVALSASLLRSCLEIEDEDEDEREDDIEDAA